MECVRSLRSVNKDTSKVKFIKSFVKFLLIYYYMTADKVTRELGQTNQEFCNVDIILPQLSILTYHLGDEQ
jgi:hypothetical protein